MLPGHGGVAQHHIGGWRSAQDVLPVGQGLAGPVGQGEIGPHLGHMGHRQQGPDGTDENQQGQHWKHKAHNGGIPGPQLRIGGQQGGQLIQ